MDKQSLRRFNNVAFDQLTAADIKELINLWVNNNRAELIRSELAEILKQIAGLVGGTDGVVTAGVLSGDTITLTVTGASDVNIDVSAISNNIPQSIALSLLGSDLTVTVTLADASTISDTITLPSSGGGLSASTYDLLSGKLKVTGSAGITATNVAGTLTIIVPLDAALLNFEVDVEVADAVYTNGLISDGFRVKVDNSANNTVGNNTNASLAFTPIFMSRTSAGTITAGNPLQWNVAINTAIMTDQKAAGISSWIFPNIPSNASAGGFILA